MHKNLRLLYITIQNQNQARALGRKIIELKLAACVNIIPKMHSIYRWEERICEDEEAILIIKTHTSRVPDITKFIQEEHTYDCPCVISISLTEDEGNEEYLHWLMNESKLQSN